MARAGSACCQDGDCLVLAVWKSALFGKPERKEWTLVRYTGRGTLGDETGPMTLGDALVRAATFAVLPLFRRSGRDPWRE